MTRPNHLSSGADEWRQGWGVLTAAASINAIVAIPNVAFGSFVEPLQAAFGWGRGEITAAFTMLGVAALVLNPIVGIGVSRWGARRIGTIGVTGLTLGLTCVGFSGPALWSWYLAWLVLAIFNPMSNVVIWSTPIIERFQRNRGIALAIMTSATGLSAAIGPIIIVFCTQTWSWRAAYWALALVVLLLGLPILRLFFHNTPRSFSTQSAQPQSGVSLKESLGAAVLTPRFWQLGIAVFISGVIASALLVHLQPMFIDAGASPQQAAATISIVGLTMVIGRLAVGFLLDRLPGPPVGAGTLILLLPPTIIMMNYDGSSLAGLVAAGALGLCLGAEYDLLAYFSSRYFNPRHYPVIFGSLFSAYALGHTLAPVIAGAVFDQFGSYQGFLAVAAALSAVSALLVLTLGNYPSGWDERQ